MPAKVLGAMDMSRSKTGMVPDLIQLMVWGVVMVHK